MHTMKKYQRIALRDWVERTLWHRWPFELLARVAERRFGFPVDADDIQHAIDQWPKDVPSRGEIRRAAAEIRKTWSKAERKVRAGRNGRQECSSVPAVRGGDFARHNGRVPARGGRGGMYGG